MINNDSNTRSIYTYMLKYVFSICCEHCQLNHDLRCVALIRPDVYTYDEALDVVAEVWKSILINNDSNTRSIYTYMLKYVFSTCCEHFQLNPDIKCVALIRADVYTYEEALEVVAEV